MAFRVTTRQILLVLVLSAVALTLWLRQPASSSSSLSSSVAQGPARPARPHFGPKSFKNIFAFGDSLSSTNFNTEYDMPTAANPFGNEYPGLTSAGGPNWLGYLIHDHMKQTLLFNFAQGGAHVNASEFNDPNPGTYDFTTQVDNFVSKVPKAGALPDWSPDSTLFVAWFGTNDVYGTFIRQRGADLYDEILGQYFAQLTRIHDVGGKNFLALTPQPLHHVRLHNFGNPLDKNLERMVHVWNDKLYAYGQEWEAMTGARLEIFDVTTLVETAIVNKVAEPCSAEEDQLPQEQCMWEDKFHLGAKPHRMIAAAVKQLFSTP